MARYEYYKVMGKKGRIKKGLLIETKSKRGLPSIKASGTKSGYKIIGVQKVSRKKAISLSRRILKKGIKPLKRKSYNVIRFK